MLVFTLLFVIFISSSPVIECTSAHLFSPSEASLDKAGTLAKLENQPYNCTLLNNLGLILFSEGDPVASIGYLSKACKLCNYTDLTVIENLAQVESSVGTFAAVDGLTRAIMQRKLLNNQGLIQQLLDILYKNRTEDGSYLRLLQLVRALPSTYHFWVLYADAHIFYHFTTHADTSKPAERKPTWDNSELNVLYFGLSLFPRCPELLLLRALHYAADGNVACALHFSQRTSEARHLEFGFVADEHYARLHHYLHELRQQRQPEPAAEPECQPSISYHTSADDQHPLVRTIHRLGVSITEDYSLGSEQPPVPGDLSLPSLQVGCSDHTICARPGFIIADAAHSVTTHILTQAYNLSMIRSASIGTLYSSHTLEHLSHNNPPVQCSTYPVSSRSGHWSCMSEMDAALSEWRRVLVTNATLYLSVPDTQRLLQMLLDPATTLQGRFQLIHIMHGGQTDQYDFHKSGFDFEHLSGLLTAHHFCDVVRVQTFGLFDDASTRNDRISLSVTARAC